MKNYQQSLAIAATPGAVYAALSTIEGLRGWWTEDCEGSAEVGGTIHFFFGAIDKDMRVERLVPGSLVHWRCTHAHLVHESVSRPDEWVGTEPVFRLRADGQGGTRLDFEHIGLVPDFECFELCNKGWQYFLASVKQYAETGEGTPHGMRRNPHCQSHERSASA